MATDKKDLKELIDDYVRVVDEEVEALERSFFELVKETDPKNHEE